VLAVELAASVYAAVRMLRLLPRQQCCCCCHKWAAA